MEKADKIILEYFLWSFTAVYGLEAVFEARNGSVAYHRLATDTALELQKFTVLRLLYFVTKYRRRKTVSYEVHYKGIS